MLRTLVSGGGLVVFALLTTGCDAAKSHASKAEVAAKKAAGEAKEAAGKAVDAAKDAIESAKDAVSKRIEEGLPKIQDKINALSGDAKTKAQEKFDELKKSLGEFKETAPDKWEALKAKATEQFEELKKMVGMDK
jgi:uncharacterized protein YjbJ (UPF0337 family)